MKTISTNLSKYVGIFAFSALVTAGVFYSTSASAADGCGFGMHMTAFGRCVPNSPGPWARPIIGNHDCWTNRWGQVRCWR